MKQETVENIIQPFIYFWAVRGCYTADVMVEAGCVAAAVWRVMETIALHELHRG